MYLNHADTLFLGAVLPRRRLEGILSHIRNFVPFLINSSSRKKISFYLKKK